MNKTPNTVILGVPRYSPIVELKGWCGKTIRRVGEVGFTEDAKCGFPIGTEVKLISVDTTNMVVEHKGMHMTLNPHYWADGKWELAE